MVYLGCSNWHFAVGAEMTAVVVILLGIAAGYIFGLIMGGILGDAYDQYIGQPARIKRSAKEFCDEMVRRERVWRMEHGEEK